VFQIFCLDCFYLSFFIEIYYYFFYLLWHQFDEMLLEFFYLLGVVYVIIFYVVLSIFLIRLFCLGSRMLHLMSTCLMESYFIVRRSYLLLFVFAFLRSIIHRNLNLDDLLFLLRSERYILLIFHLQLFDLLLFFYFCLTLLF
jgi:hypothetical protein